MKTINNIYKSNLDVIINWNEGELIVHKHNNDDSSHDNNNNYNDYYNDNKKCNILEIDGCYFNFFKNIIPDFNNIIEIFNKSFNHYLILISMFSNIENIDTDYNELNNEEYISNIIKYLEQSLESLYRFKEYYNKRLEYDKLEKLYNNCISQLDLIKDKKIIHSFYEIKRLEEEKKKEKEKENMTTYNNENDLFTELNFEDIEFENSSNNCRNILTYFSNILIRITNIVYKYTGFDITFGN